MHGPSANSEESTCAICLQGYEALDRAVISSCLHAFCIGCLQAWCRKSEARLCPLCKRRIVGYIYAIKSDHDYREHVFEDELQQQPHELEQWPVQLLQPSQGITSSSSRATHQHSIWTGQQQQLNAVHGGIGAHETQRPRIQLRAEPGYTWGHPADWRRDVLQARRRLHSARSAAGTAGNSSSSTHQRHSSSNRWDEAAPGSRGEAAASTATGGAGGVAPRPYYWRVQQRMLASVTRQHSSSGTAANDSNTVLEARRAIYRNNLWAVPHHTAVAHHTATAAAAGVSSSNICSASSIRVSEAALESWMDRELQALLLEDDVTIICAYVKGLVSSFGVTVPTAQQHQQRGVQEVSHLQSMRQAAAHAAAAAGFSNSSTDTAAAAGGGNTGTLTSAVAALEGFLFEAAGHFWHELCCYASSGLTVTAWDRVARYVHRDQLQQHLPQQQQQPHAVVASCEAVAGCIEDVAGHVAHQQQQQQQQQQQHQGIAQPVRLDQELSAVRDAAAVAGFLERQQLLQRARVVHQPAAAAAAAAAAGSDGAAATSAAPAAVGGSADGAAAESLVQSQQPQLVAGGRRGSSSSGSSNSKDWQQQHHPISRDSTRNSRQRSRSRSRSRSRCCHTSHRHEHAQQSHGSRSSRRRDDGSSRQQHQGRRSEGTRHSNAATSHSQSEQHKQYISGSAFKSRHDSSGGLARQYRYSSSADLAQRSTIAAAAAGASTTHKVGAGLGRWGDDWDSATDEVVVPAHDAPGIGRSHGQQQCQQQQQQQQQQGCEWGVGLLDDRWQMESMQC